MTDTINELSKKTLKSYMKKSTTSGDRAWDKAGKEEDKSMSTDGTKYPEKQKRHMDNASKALDVWRKRDSGQTLAKKKLKLKEDTDMNEDMKEFSPATGKTTPLKPIDALGKGAKDGLGKEFILAIAEENVVKVEEMVDAALRSKIDEMLSVEDSEDDESKD